MQPRQLEMEKIPTAVWKNLILPKLELIDLINLSETCKSSHGFFTKKGMPLDPLFLLIQMVVNGQQKKAELLVKHHPDLLFVKTTIQDPAGRHFKNLSAFQYAVWSWDYPMLQMIKKYIVANDDKQLAMQQFIELEKFSTEYGCTYSLDPLIKALKEFTENGEAFSLSERMEYCCDIIGGIQRTFPISIWSEYAREDQAFNGSSDFNRELLTRNTTYFDEDTNQYIPLFPLCAEKGVGFDYAIWRLSESSPYFNNLSEHERNTEAFKKLKLYSACSRSPKSVVPDRDGFIQLKKDRMVQLINFKKSLAQPCKKNNKCNIF